MALFVDIPAPPVVENIHEPTALESTEETVILSKVPPLHKTSWKRTVTTDCSLPSSAERHRNDCTVAHT